ncbi:TetR/AcrR family transcriptional regulator [Phycicoccus sp. Root101]|uniref:TetR/AcrR family transcriptional regulator n=1 Tax=Phycicoccus sp. Root101 TaxID=1736421 RepID=UPI000B2497EC|nr:TetR/AcrR family transcriptional regulator [Phycicoccus sp. Root101]
MPTDDATRTGSAPMGIRARNRAAMEEEILEAGRRHLARDGAAALSLRAVARDLGMVSSALYRYVANRDDLLTLLIVAAYTSLGDAVEEAHGAIPDDDLGGRWDAIAHGLRTWALAHPHEYALVYGSPVPDYDAPSERTTEPGTRVQLLLVRLLADATRSGQLATGEDGGEATDLAERAVGTMVRSEFFEGSGVDARTLVTGLAAWSLVMGTLSTELFEQLGADTVTDKDAYFASMVTIARRLVLSS